MMTKKMMMMIMTMMMMLMLMLMRPPLLLLLMMTMMMMMLLLLLMMTMMMMLLRALLSLSLLLLMLPQMRLLRWPPAPWPIHPQIRDFLQLCHRAARQFAKNETFDHRVHVSESAFLHLRSTVYAAVCGRDELRASSAALFY